MESNDQHESAFSANIRKDFLWVDLPRGHQMVCTRWPTMKAWIRISTNEGWQRYRPDFDIVTGMIGSRSLISGDDPINLLRKNLAGEVVKGGVYDWNDLVGRFSPVRQFFSDVPTEQARLTSRFFDRQWRMLEMAAQCGSCALELMGSNPALAFCVASYSSFVSGSPPVDFSNIASLLQKRRRYICGELGFRADESAVRILGKVPPEHCLCSLLLSLRVRLRCSWVRNTLSHLPVINKAVLGVLHSKSYESVTPAFLAECAAFDEVRLKSSLPGKLLDEARQLFHRWRRRPLPKRYFTNVEQLQKFIEKVEKRVNAEQFQRVINHKLPPAPVLGTGTVQPLSTPWLLLEEAQNMGNCVDAYAEEVARGTRYFYRMTSPERATIELVNTGTDWKLGELARAYNKPVAVETQQTVEAWLASSPQ